MEWGNSIFVHGAILRIPATSVFFFDLQRILAGWNLLPGVVRVNVVCDRL
jgi:hypothetical protein